MVLLMATLLVALFFRCNFGERVFTRCHKTMLCLFAPARSFEPSFVIILFVKACAVIYLELVLYEYNLHRSCVTVVVSGGDPTDPWVVPFEVHLRSSRLLAMISALEPE
jgi:hypothetical protein